MWEGADDDAVRGNTGDHDIYFNILTRGIPIGALPETGKYNFASTTMSRLSSQHFECVQLFGGALRVREGADGDAARSDIAALHIPLNTLRRGIPIGALPETGKCKLRLNYNVLVFE